jgi:transposase-like protein
MPYRGKILRKNQEAISVLLSEGMSVRAIAKELDINYGQIRGYVEHLSSERVEPPHSPKMLVFDIENAPNLTWNWGLWKQNAIDVEQFWYFLSYSYAWYDLRTDKIGPTGFVSIYQDPEFYPDTNHDLYVVGRLWELLDEADIVIGQNSKSFDVKKFNARAVIHHMLPPAPFQQIDTKTAASEVGAFGSNSLKYLARQLDITLKQSNRGWELWRECMKGDPEAWAEMEEYNRNDVVATAELYSRLRPWMTSRQHPNLGMYVDAKGRVCTKCTNKEKAEGGEGFQVRGYQYTNASKFTKVVCNHCGSYARDYRREKQNTPETRVELR